MAQTLFGSNATPSLPLLDQNFTQLYDLREYWTTPGYTGASPKFTVDGSFNLGLIAGLTVGSNIGGGGTSAFAYTIGANPLASVTDGAFIQFYGSTHATNPGVLLLGNSAATSRMRLYANGDFLQISSGSIGYGAGSGGTVTQATSKATSVVLNKTNGQIVMNSAALAAGASVGFIVTNSMVAATDVVVVSLTNGSVAAPGAYAVSAHPAPSAFSIYVRNTSAGSLSEALVINFAVIKAVTT